tara:strand:+ start:104 stop:418 length:315 start_codon:yes stop_codon:yes gene_type:complete
MNTADQIVAGIKQRQLSNEDMIEVAIGVVHLLHFRAEILTNQIEENPLKFDSGVLILTTWFLTQFEIVLRLLATLRENKEALENFSNIFAWEERLPEHEDEENV